MITPRFIPQSLAERLLSYRLVPVFRCCRPCDARNSPRRLSRPTLSLLPAHVVPLPSGPFPYPLLRMRTTRRAKWKQDKRASSLT